MKFIEKYKFPIAVFIIWRIFLFLVQLAGEKILPFKFSFPYTDTILIPSGLPNWLWSWGNFDGVHYLTIAKSGYDGFGTQVFFPLYPMLINGLSRLVPNYLLSGLIISKTKAVTSETATQKL